MRRICRKKQPLSIALMAKDIAADLDSPNRRHCFCKNLGNGYDK